MKRLWCGHWRQKKRSCALILISLHPPSVPCAGSDSLTPLYYVNSRVTDTIYSSYNTKNKYRKHKPGTYPSMSDQFSEGKAQLWLMWRAAPATTHCPGSPTSCLPVARLRHRPSLSGYPGMGEKQRDLIPRGLHNFMFSQTMLS